MLLFLLCLFAFTNVHAQNSGEAAVKNILAQQTASWNRGDIEGFMKGYWKNDSLMFIGKSGVTYGWQNTFDTYKKNYPDVAAMGQLTFTLIKIQKLSNSFFAVVGKWRLARNMGNLQGHFTLLFKNIGGNWVIVQDHSS